MMSLEIRKPDPGETPLSWDEKRILERVMRSELEQHHARAHLRDPAFEAWLFNEHGLTVEEL